MNLVGVYTWLILRFYYVEHDFAVDINIATKNCTLHVELQFFFVPVHPALLCVPALNHTSVTAMMPERLAALQAFFKVFKSILKYMLFKNIFSLLVFAQKLLPYCRIILLEHCVHLTAYAGLFPKGFFSMCRAAEALKRNLGSLF